MKKRCTNPSCRKEFRVEPLSTVCPHCGKKYPRVSAHFNIMRDGKAGTWSVILTRCGPQKLATIKALRKMSGFEFGVSKGTISLKHGKMLIDNPPSLAAVNLSFKDAETWVGAIQAADSQAIMVRTRKLKKMRVFVYRP